MNMRTSIESRLESKYIPEPNSGCWIWIGCIDKCGYGKMSVGKESLAHRVSYRLYKGEIPDDLEIDHKCRVRCCVNPDHLEAVTHTENIARGEYAATHRNRVKKHCKRGHELTGDNLILKKYKNSIRRNCRLCHNNNTNKRNHLKREKVGFLNVTNKSGYNGVNQHPTTKKWQARIYINKKEIYLGVFSEKEDAILARKSAEKRFNYNKKHCK